MYVSLVTDPNQLATLREAWNNLAGKFPFRSWDWLESWWRHYAKGHLNVLLVRSAAGELLGIAPWFLEFSPARGRVLRWLGSGEACSEYPGILCQTGHHQAVVESLAEWLIPAGTPEPGAAAWDLLELEAVDASDVALGSLARCLAQRGASLTERTSFNCWKITHAGTWEEYVGSLSKSHRKQVRRVERACLESGLATLRQATAASLDADWALFVDLHQRRRQSLGEPGCFADPRFAGFLRLAAARLLEREALRLHLLELDGRTIAAEFHLVGEGQVFAYQAGIEPECLDEEPGRLMNIAVLKNSLARGDSSFDLLRGDEPYKAHWRAAPCPMVTWRLVPPLALARLRHGIWLAGDTFKGILKAGLKRTGVRSH